MFFVFRLLIHMVAILIISYLLPGLIRVDSVTSALVAAFLLGIVNISCSAYPCLSYPPPHHLDTGPLSPRHQRPDALACLGRGERVLRERVLGSALWIDSNQHRQLDLVQVFALLKRPPGKSILKSCFLNSSALIYFLTGI